MAAITTGGLPTALRLRGRFHKSLCEASRVHVRGNTCLSPVTWTQRVNCSLGDKHGSDDSCVFRVRGPFNVSHVSTGCCGVMSCHVKDYHWMFKPPVKQLWETEIPKVAERQNLNNFKTCGLRQFHLPTRTTQVFPRFPQESQPWSLTGFPTKDTDTTDPGSVWRWVSAPTVQQLRCWLLIKIDYIVCVDWTTIN